VPRPSQIFGGREGARDRNGTNRDANAAHRAKVIFSLADLGGSEIQGARRTFDTNGCVRPKCGESARIVVLLEQRSNAVIVGPRRPQPWSVEEQTISFVVLACVERDKVVHLEGSKTLALRFISISAAACLLCACTSNTASNSQQGWVKDAATQSDFDKDSYSCTAVLVRPEGVRFRAVNQQQYQACMVSRGWTQQGTR
jgi:hypothetical protein